MCVCVWGGGGGGGVKSYLTSGASVHPENTITYSADNEGQKSCGVFSETAPLQRSSIPFVESHMYGLPYSTHVHYVHVVALRALHFSALIIKSTKLNFCVFHIPVYVMQAGWVWH